MRISDLSSDVCSSDLPDGARGGPVAPRARAGPATGSWHEPMRVTESHLRKWSLLQVSNGSCAVGMAMAGLVLGRGVNGSVSKIGGSKTKAVALHRSGGSCARVVENAHDLGQHPRTNPQRPQEKRPA